MRWFHRRPKDFVVFYDDGTQFSSDDGDWYQMDPKLPQVDPTKRIAKVVVGGFEIGGAERYAFSWEAEAVMGVTAGESGLRPTRVDEVGRKSALLIAAVYGDEARTVRIPLAPDGSPSKEQRIVDMRRPVRKVVFRAEIWRMGLGAQQS